jgi:hypothetical protein
MSNNKMNKSLDELIKSNRDNQRALTVVKRDGDRNKPNRGGFRPRRNWNGRDNENWNKGKQFIRDRPGFTRRNRFQSDRRDRRDRNTQNVCNLI